MPDTEVTRDWISAELLRLELRLERNFATGARVDELEVRFLTKEAVKEMIGDALRDSDARGWTTRNRMMALCVFAVTVATFVLNVWAVRR